MKPETKVDSQADIKTVKKIDKRKTKGVSSTVEIKQWKIFELYCTMPDKDRSYEALTQLLHKNGTKVSFRTIKRWGTTYGWQDKLKVIAERIAKDTEEKARKALQIDSLQDIKIKQLKITKVFIANIVRKLANEINENRFVDYGLADLDRLMKHEWVVSGGLHQSIPNINPINAVQVNISQPIKDLQEVIMQMPPEMRDEAFRIMAEKRRKEIMAEKAKAEARPIELETAGFQQPKEGITPDSIIPAPTQIEDINKIIESIK